MSTFWQALYAQPLLQSILLASFFASFVSGIVGSYVVVKRIVFVAGSISHAVLSGIGICLWLERSQGITWASPLYGALGAALLSALFLGWMHLRFREREDSAISAIWSIGMAVGVLFISQTPGFNVELTNFLVGNVLWISKDDLVILGLLNVIVIGFTVILHKRFLAICFDEEQARLQGVAVDGLYQLLLLLIAVSVVLLIQVVGVLLVMTMLTIPPAVASLGCSRLSSVMGWASIMNLGLCFSGHAIAYDVDWPPGATIALVAGVIYVGAFFVSAYKPRERNRLRKNLPIEL